MPEKLSLYLHDSVREEVEQRGQSKAKTIARDLDRLYTLYKYAMAEVTLTQNEAMALMDVLNGTIMDVQSASLLWASVEDACILDSLDQKWEIDKESFVNKLKGLSRTQALALVDATERLWTWVSANPGQPVTREVLEKFYHLAPDSQDTTGS